MAKIDIGAANREALERLCRARATWTGVRPAREALGLSGRTILHAGPSIEWERMCGPMRGGVVAGILHEEWAASPADALELAASGEVAFLPCHARGAVGPMTGIISPSMPVLVVEDRANGTTAYSSINEGMGRTVRFGAHGPETIARLAWMRDVLAPALHAVVEREGGVDLTGLMGQALSMGDEMHMRNAAATCLQIKALATPLAAATDLSVPIVLSGGVAGFAVLAALAFKDTDSEATGRLVLAAIDALGVAVRHLLVYPVPGNRLVHVPKRVLLGDAYPEIPVFLRWQRLIKSARFHQA